jgi:hypothetical protein
VEEGRGVWSKETTLTKYCASVETDATLKKATILNQKCRSNPDTLAHESHGQSTQPLR